MGRSSGAMPTGRRCSIFPTAITIRLANGVLCYIPDIKTLKEVVQESIRIMKPGGIMSATVLTDNEKHPLGARYGSCTLAISQKKFWEALQKELGYTIIAIDCMGLWEGHSFQKSRYAIQLRKLQPSTEGTDNRSRTRRGCF